MGIEGLSRVEIADYVASLEKENGELQMQIERMEHAAAEQDERRVEFVLSLAQAILLSGRALEDQDVETAFGCYDTIIRHAGN